MATSRAGFTLIELLVVIGILSLLVVAFAPDIRRGSEAAYQAADAQNLRQLFSWVENGYKQKTRRYPLEGGHKFVLAPWVDGVVEKTPKNLDRFFNPALCPSNPHYLELQQRDPDTVWTSYQDVSSADTDYAGRKQEFLRALDSGREAWMADDNEGGWAFRDGSIHVLYGDGNVVTLAALDLKQRFGWTQIKADNVFPTYGPESPHPDLKKLDR